MVPETRVFQTVDGEDFLILVAPFLTDPPVLQTDRWTDRIAMAKMR